MINLPSDYKSAHAYDGSSFPKLTVGGHICRTREVTVSTNPYGQQQLTVNYDIVEEGELKNYFQQIYRSRVAQDPNTKWPGWKWITVTNDDGTTSGIFKGFIEAIEASNPGYKFDGNELGLQNKLVGFNFREREYEVRDTGEIKTVVEPFYAVSVAKVREGVVPPPKKAWTGSGRMSQAAPPPPPPPRNEQQGMNLYGQPEDDDLPF